MIDRRPFTSLGGGEHGWLNARHHFSFAGYHDPAKMGWGALRVWNDDEIAPHSGFPPHPHSDMEIITYVTAGAISHEDSLGNHGQTAAGDVQVMSAGSGVRHAEYNREDEATRLFQIWIEPATRGGVPSWGTKPFPKRGSGGFVTLASGYPEDRDALPIRAEARVMAATVATGERITLDLDPAGHAYLVPASGSVTVNAVHVEPRDGLAVTGEARIEIVGVTDAEIVLVDAA